MLLKNIEPFVRNILYANLSSDTKNIVSTELRTPDCRLFYIIKGHGYMTVENKNYSLLPGCLILFRGGTKYTWNVEIPGVEYLAVNFDYTMNFSNLVSSFHVIHSKVFKEDDILETVDFEDAKELNEPIYLADASPLEFYLRHMATEAHLKNRYTKELLSSCMKLVIISIAHLAQRQSSDVNNMRHDSIIKRVIHYIEDNCHKDLTNDEIGKLFHFNPSYLNRIFKQYTGNTLHNFLRCYRINLAAELLSTTDASVTEIAESVGFSDLPHFVKSFKDITGKSPGSYRKSITDEKVNDKKS